MTRENGRELLENFVPRKPGIGTSLTSQSHNRVESSNHGTMTMASKQGRLLALLAVAAAACLLLPSASASTAVEYCSEYPASETSFAAALGY
jgi:hypothetical protein